MRSTKRERRAAPTSEQPLREELYSVDQLDQHARALASAHRLRGRDSRRGPDRLLPRLTENEDQLRKAYDLVADAVRRGRRITPAAEWFLDNYHLVEEQVRIARRHLPRGYSQQLPQLGNGPWAGHPRAYAIAVELISHSDGRVDAESIRAFVAAYQASGPLLLGELWAIPIMLRLGLLENLRRVVARVTAGRHDRERAAVWVDRMLEAAAKAPAEVVIVLAEMVKESPSLTTAFVSEFASRVQGRGRDAVFPITWLEHRMAEQGQTIETVFQLASQSQAADQMSIGNSIGSLRFLEMMEWRDFVEKMSSVEQVLRREAAGVYALMDFATRDQYRHVVEDIARHGSCTENEVAEHAVRLAGGHAGGRKAHVGYFLVGKGRRALEESAGVPTAPSERLRRIGRRFPLCTYVGAIAGGTIVATALTLVCADQHPVSPIGRATLGCLTFACAGQLAVAIVNMLATRWVRPEILPRLDFARGIPTENKALVAVPAILSDAAEVEQLLESLEVRFLANRDGNLLFALLTDFSDAAAERMPADEQLLRQAREGIDALNAKYVDGPFFLFHRARRWNAREGAWMGWERKRGKLEQLNGALRGDPEGFDAIVGPAERLGGVRYVITLDSDTQLPRDAARLLVGTMAHPLNRPRFDPVSGRVVEGYGILQPRVGISIQSANRSQFSRLFSGEPGIDPYTRAVSDVYQDVFGEGSFIGKGIYDVDVFQQAIGGQLPDDRILSHDLLEGAYARSGLASDVLLFEEYPSSYLVDVTRRRRWIRGDWQIVRWLMPNVPGPGDRRAARVRNPISPLSRWKILDNARRSITPAAMLALLVVGWVLPGQALLFTLVILTILWLPAILNCVADISRKPSDLPIATHVRWTAYSLSRQGLQQAFLLACLPFDAWVNLWAMGRTALRLLTTGRNLLEWRTARDGQRAALGRFSDFYASMWFAPATAIACAWSLWLVRPGALAVAAPVTATWLMGPLVAWHISRNVKPRPSRLTPDDRTFLTAVARRTWRFFEAFVGPDDHHLPPDNFQEDPPQGLAHRTSPTNIGMALLSNLAAYDFGFITAGGVIDRTTPTLSTLERLQRHRGHFYNWYDTQTLEPLRPLYVSTVDSGNLSGHLLTLAAGLDQLSHGKAYDLLALFRGLGNTVDQLVGTPPARDDAALLALVSLLPELREPPEGISLAGELLNRVLLATDAPSTGRETSDREWWAGAVSRQCRAALSELDIFFPWRVLLERTPRSDALEIPDLLNEIAGLRTLPQLAGAETSLSAWMDAAKSVSGAETWIVALRTAVTSAAESAANRMRDLRGLAVRCRELADVDYGFLYDKDRRLLSIGYNIADRRLETGFYDLLASEARLGSYVAIAQGKLPQDHWFSLGRSLTSAGGGKALLSWSGSMFEYLMPLLVMPTYGNTLLDETYGAVVRRQVEYGEERGVPWGISESGYTKVDAHLNYQYQAFGVPGLGFKRGLASDLVIAPYATAMALMVEPELACANLRLLAGEGRLHTYGFYEAVDYTPSRLPRGRESAVVKSYMVHHQGMTFLSLAYALLGRPMQRRFESDPALRATDLLLQERVPKSAATVPHPAEESDDRGTPAPAAANYRTFTTARTPVPEVHLLSNGRYHVAVTAAGGGYSRWRDLAVTRWREDATRDCWGTFCYVRNVKTGDFWSAAHQPTTREPARFEATYSQGRAEFSRRDGEIETHLEISVSPEDDIELRRVSVTNRGREPQTIELTSYAEVVLAPSAADAAHPAFSNLFVQTKILGQRQAIICTRRPRSAGERPPWMLHLMTVHGAPPIATSYETDRAEFIGRGRSLSDPASMHRASLGGGEGSVLDPVVAIRNSVVVGPDETIQVHFVTGVAETEDGALALIEKYRDSSVADRVFELAWTHSQVVARQIDAADGDAQLYGRLASSILYANPALRAPASLISRNRRSQSGLWAYGISGDLPIVLLRVGDQSQMTLVRQLVQAHAYWRAHGLPVDLVIWNEDLSGYRQALQEQINAVVTSRSDSNLLDKPGGIFVRRLEQIAEEDKILMQSVARIIISDSAGTLEDQVGRRVIPPVPAHRFRPVRNLRTEVFEERASPPRDLALFNGHGGFTQDGREYVIVTNPEKPTPAPWVNVIANPWFGTVVSEGGSAYTWCENAHSFRLTPWSNDAVSDVGGEAFYLRDEETGRFWSPSPFPTRGKSSYTTRHGFGYSVFECSEGGLSTSVCTYVAADAPVKFVTLKLTNTSGRPRRISITGYFELVLGDRREVHSPHIVTEVDPKTGALLARNAYNGEFAERVVFLDSSEASRTVTGERAEFLGRNGDPSDPASMRRAALSGRVGAGVDPCVAMQVAVDLAEGQQCEIVFTFGSGRDLADARNLITRFHGVVPARRALDLVSTFWNDALGAVQVETPDASLNFLVNGWLMYQTISCRIWGRSGFYQSGGAFGFRDQLQDAMALVHAKPAMLREQILLCASRQFREGDVQHWWHPPLGRGVRTRISDDYLWLPYATCRYVAAIGDTGILDQESPFLEGRTLQPGEDSYYDLPGRSESSATLYEHCVRAIKNGLRFGEHGLPLMGTGDWNDGMNLVGEQGKGESVWLAFFLHDVLTQFSGLAGRRGDDATQELCMSQAAELRKNIESHAWDGEWYRRAYFDSGEPLGSSENVECQIDSLPQSWSVLSGAGDPDRSRRAMKSVDEKLVRRDIGIIQLFEPPFDKSGFNPGYIAGYVPGVRENGGQYTHAAIWTVMAFAAAGDSAKAWELFRLINPLRHGDSEASIGKYKVEPYVVAADVYANPQHAGRGGWTWYTGSAGWMYRLMTESLLGLRREMDELRFTPCLPGEWKTLKIRYRYHATFYDITFHSPEGGGTTKRISIDGSPLPYTVLKLVNDQRVHTVDVELG